MNDESRAAADWPQHRWAPLAVALLCSIWVVFIGPVNKRLPLFNLPAGPAADDVIIHSQTIASAAEAQSEGSFIIREAPRLQWPAAQRYPLFQFYSYLPYYLAGLLVHAGFGPYPALVAMFFLSFLAGAWGAYGLARAMGQSREAGLLCSAAFTLSPYHISDLFGRYAYPEVVCFGLIPLLFWSGLECSRRGSLGSFLAHSACWASIILSHNIFHVWTLPVLALWLAYLKFVNGRSELRVLAPAGAYLLGLGISFFFFAVPLRLGPQVAIINIFGDTLTQGLTPAWVLFYPDWAQTYGTRSSPDLGLQVGWPYLAAFLGAFRARSWRVLSNGAWVLFALAVFGAWSPVNFWPWMGPFQVIAFPYRLLLYTTLFGVMLMGEWADGLPRWQLRQWLPWMLAGLLLLGLPWKRTGGLAMTGADMDASWKASGPRVPGGVPYYAMSFGWLDTKYKDQNFFEAAGASTVKRSQGPDKLEWLSADPAAVQVSDFKSSATTTLKVKSDEAHAYMVLPAFWYPGLYRVAIDGKPVPYGFVGQNLSVALQPGVHDLAYTLVGDSRANWLSLACAMLWLGLAWRWFRGRRPALPEPLPEPPPVAVKARKARPKRRVAAARRR